MSDTSKRRAAERTGVQRRSFGGTEIELNNLDKVLYPATGTTKAEVIDYFTTVAPVLLPHLAGRPVTRKRWPDGVARPSFFEKNLPGHAPRWLQRQSVEHAARRVVYPIVDSVAGLAWLAQQAALELHVPQWRFVAGRRGPSTRLVFDLDPGPDVGLAECAAVALAIRDTVHDAGMTAYPVTSGSKGIHLYVPLQRPLSGTAAAEVARQLATGLQRLLPDVVTTSMSKAARPGRVFLDWSQNNQAKTTIVPYSLRGREHPTVAAPRSWEEIEARDCLRQLTFDEVLGRWRADGDLVAELKKPTRAQPVAPKPSPAVQPEPVGTQVALPRDLSPMLATPGDVATLDAQSWAFETKWDGFRLFVEVAGSAATIVLRSRAGNIVTQRYPKIVAMAAELVGHAVVLDGEAVVFDDEGVSNFGLMQASAATAVFVAFDVLYLDGTSLLRKKYADRRRVLQALAQHVPSLRVPDQLTGSGAQALQTSRDCGLEGVVAKRKDSVYLPGRRGQSWVKTRNWRTQQVIVGGFRRSDVRPFASLLVGMYSADTFYFVGRVGTGFDERELARLYRRMSALRQGTSPFNNDLSRDEASDAVWVTPEITGTVRYMNWTDSGRMRHPAWLG